MVQGPFAISLNQCCCGEDAGCLDGVCFVTIEFSGIENPTFTDQPDIDSPPFLHVDFNRGVPLDPADPLTPEDCQECEDWNGEWQLYLLPDNPTPDSPDQVPGDGSTVFTFALGQARDNDGTDVTKGSGFQLELKVYDVPKAGDACFPCAEINENTGLQLVVTCVGNEISADLTVVVRGCTLATWHWNLYEPDVFDSEGGGARRADHLTNDFIKAYQPQTFQACYTPAGTCVGEPCFGNQFAPACIEFPCFVSFTIEGVETSNDIARFYDRHNCFWSNSPSVEESSSSTSTLSSSTVSTSSSADGESKSSVTASSFSSVDLDTESDKPLLRFYACESTTGVDNPDACDPCFTNLLAFDSDLFGDIGDGIATQIQPYDQPEVALNDHVWRLRTENKFGNQTSFRDVGEVRIINGEPCPAVIPLDPVICTYRILLRWGRNTSPTASAKLAIYTTDRGNGPPVDFETGRTDPELPIADGTLDGKHNDFVSDDGFKFRTVGQIKLSCDARITIQFSGPRAIGAEIDFDAVVLRRL